MQVLNPQNKKVVRDETLVSANIHRFPHVAHAR